MPATLREATETVTVTTADGRSFLLPAGTAVLISPYVMHRLPQFWGPDAEAFNPDRWMGSSSDPLAWMPFLSGPRSCIGRRFALMEMQVILATLVANFNMTLRPGAVVTPKLAITMQPHPSLPMMVSRVV